MTTSYTYTSGILKLDSKIPKDKHLVSYGKLGKHRY